MCGVFARFQKGFQEHLLEPSTLTYVKVVPSDLQAQRVWLVRGRSQEDLEGDLG